MALTHLKILVSNPSKPEKEIAVEFLIDSGAIYSVIPSSILQRMGIKPQAEREFILADGKTIKRKLGIARFRHNGDVGGATVMFGQKEDSTLLGATTLEALGLALNPLQRTLVPLPMVL